MDRAIRDIDEEKSLFLINSMAVIVIGIVMITSIDTIFNKDQVQINPNLKNVLFHFIMFANLLIDWASANCKNLYEDGLMLFSIFGIVALLLLEGYLSILALDGTKTVPIILFLATIIFGMSYDIAYYYKKLRNEDENKSKIYALSCFFRGIILVVLIIPIFLTPLITNNPPDIVTVSIISVPYIIAKSIRIMAIHKRTNKA